MFHTRYIVLVSVGGALAYTYRRALHDHIDGDPGWLAFVAVWLPAALLLGLLVAYVVPAIVWRLRGVRAATSAGRPNPMFAADGPFFAWVLPLALAVVAGGLLARGDHAAALVVSAAALGARPLVAKLAAR